MHSSTVTQFLCSFRYSRSHKKASRHKQNHYSEITSIICNFNHEAQRKSGAIGCSVTARLPNARKIVMKNAPSSLWHDSNFPQKYSTRRAWFMTFNSGTKQTQPLQQWTQLFVVSSLPSCENIWDWRPAQNLINIKAARFCWRCLAFFCRIRLATITLIVTSSEGRQSTFRRRRRELKDCFYNRTRKATFLYPDLSTWGAQLKRVSGILSSIIRSSHSSPLTASKYETMLLFACCPKLFLNLARDSSSGSDLILVFVMKKNRRKRKKRWNERNLKWLSRASCTKIRSFSRWLGRTSGQVDKSHFGRLIVTHWDAFYGFETAKPLAQSSPR